MHIYFHFYWANEPLIVCSHLYVIFIKICPGDEPLCKSAQIAEGRYVVRFLFGPAYAVYVSPSSCLGGFMSDDFHFYPTEGNLILFQNSGTTHISLFLFKFWFFVPEMGCCRSFRAVVAAGTKLVHGMCAELAQNTILPKRVWLYLHSPDLLPLLLLLLLYMFSLFCSNSCLIS